MPPVPNDSHTPSTQPKASPLPSSTPSPSAVAVAESEAPTPQITRADLDRPVVDFARPAFSALRADMSVDTALRMIRTLGLTQRIIYFYVVDDEHRLVGVIPTRRLLTAALDVALEKIMIKRLFFLTEHQTIREAAQIFAEKRFLALPVLNDDGQVIGVMDIEPFAGELHNINERTSFDDVYQFIGVSLSKVESASSLVSFRYRFPWLLTTICSGTAAALLTGLYETTLAAALVLTFFITLVLGLAESVSMQSMTLTLQALHHAGVTWKQFWLDIRKELVVALMLGGSCGGIVGLFALIWKQRPTEAVIIAVSIIASMIVACALGTIVPFVLRALQRDPKIAAGPITLAMTDLCTLLFYLSVARWLIGQ